MKKIPENPDNQSQNNNAKVDILLGCGGAHL